MNFRAYDSLDQPPDATEAPKSKVIISLAVGAQIFGVAAVVMAVVWMGYYCGGFDWADPNLVFNYHPVFMVLGLVLCFGDAMLIYRVFRFLPKLPLKAVHAVLMLLSLLFSVVGLKSVFDSHNLRNTPNLYSIHSWIGLVTVVLFACQWIVGLVTFLVPSVPLRLRAMILPKHTSLGMLLFFCAITACISGITEKNIFIGGNRPMSYSVSTEDLPFKREYSDLPAGAMLSNFMGLSLVIFGGIVFYLTVRHDYRRVEPKIGEQVGFTSMD